MNNQFKRKTVGEILIEQGDLAAAELAFVLDKQKTTPLRFGRICVMDGLVSDEAVSRLSGSFPLKKEGPQTVKGFSKPIIVHKIL